MAKEIEFLVDTNIWLERLLEQEKSDEVKKFLDEVSPHQLFISDFSVHSIAIIMSNLEKYDDYLIFIDDLFINAKMIQLELAPEETKEVFDKIKDSNLDFDDAYQYYVGQKYKLKIVTFDQDFIKSGIQTYEPKEALSLIKP
jgi:hypothetical protein